MKLEFKFIFIILFYLSFLNCSKRISNSYVPAFKNSNKSITIQNEYFDTLESYFELLGNRHIAFTNSLNETFFISLERPVKLQLQHRKWVKTAIPIFNNGIIGNYLFYSNLINDSFIFIIDKRIIWKYNVVENNSEYIHSLEKGIQHKSGSIFWHDNIPSQSPSIIFYNENNSLYFPIYTNNKKEKEYFICRLNLVSKESEILEIERKNIDAPIQKMMQESNMFLIDSNKLNIAFAYNKIGYRINLDNNKIDTLNLQSPNDTIENEVYNKIKGKNKEPFGERYMKTKLFNAFYSYFRFNPFKNHYYKVFFKSLEEFNTETGLRNTLAEKRLVLQIFDDSLFLIKEIDLSDNFNWVNQVLPTQNGVLLFNSSNSGNYNLPGKTLIMYIDYE